MKKNKHSKRMKYIGSFLMFAILAVVTFSIVAPETFTDCMGWLSVPTAGISLSILSPMFTIQRDPNPDPGSQEQKFLNQIKDKIEEGTKVLKDKVAEIETKDTERKTALTTVTEKLAALEAKYKEVKDVEEFKMLAKEFSDLAVEFKAFKENGAEKDNISHSEVIEKALEAQKDEIKLIATGKSRNVKLLLKNAGPITTSSFGAGVLRGLRLPGSDPLLRNQQTILPEITIINGGPGSDPFSWVERVVGEGAAAPTTEGNDKPLYDWDYVENKVTAEMIAAIVVVSKQALLRMPMLMQNINEELLNELREVLQTQIITGSGIAPNLNGIKTNAVPFNPPSQQLTQNANNYDVIAALASQVMLAHGTPGVVGVNPGMFYQLQTLKDGEDRYLLPPFISGMPESFRGGLIIAGMRIIPMWDLGADEFLGGDLTRYMFNIVEDVNIEIGYFDAIWRKNQLAVRAEIFGNGGVKTQYKPQIVKGTFTYARAILDGAVSS